MKILIIVFIIISVIILGFLFIGWIFSSPGYKGPVSDHFDGKRFINPGGMKAKGFGEVMKWMRNRERGPWTEMTDIAYGDKPVDRVNGDTVRVTFINHSTFLIQTEGLNILTDPVWSERASPVGFAGPKRMRPPGIRLEDLPHIDIILLTHNHYDHLDIRTMKTLAREHDPVVYCPLGVGKFLQRKGIRKVEEMDWWDEIKINDALGLVCTPAQHFSGRGMFDRDRTLWSGFALMTGKGSIYYSGDTGYGNFFGEITERISPIRFSFLPIGAYKPEWFMAVIHTSPADAVKIHREMASPLSIGMHFGTFPLADDGMTDPERDLQAAMKESGVGGDEFIVPVPGKAVVISTR